jgi:hypothetical protein
MSTDQKISLTPKDLLIGGIEVITKVMIGLVVYIVTTMQTNIDTIEAKTRETHDTVIEIKTEQKHNDKRLTSLEVDFKQLRKN